MSEVLQSNDLLKLAEGISNLTLKENIEAVLNKGSIEETLKEFATVLHLYGTSNITEHRTKWWWATNAYIGDNYELFVKGSDGAIQKIIHTETWRIDNGASILTPTWYFLWHNALYKKGGSETYWKNAWLNVEILVWDVKKMLKITATQIWWDWQSDTVKTADANWKKYYFKTRSANPQSNELYSTETIFMRRGSLYKSSVNEYSNEANIEMLKTLIIDAAILIDQSLQEKKHSFNSPDSLKESMEVEKRLAKLKIEHTSMSA